MEHTVTHAGGTSEHQGSTRHDTRGAVRGFKGTWRLYESNRQPSDHMNVLTDRF